MTDEDRALLNALTDACDKFSLSLTGNRLSQGEQIEIALIFLDLADHALKRVLDIPMVNEDNPT
ncbi:MAG TPA: hypothetical protein VFQ77_07785 [Pseudonocardiaceae bacterium]|jgi:hypothetical protein|nr:hypothetical protein [Pseudonocardiaceae bacterium]